MNQFAITELPKNHDPICGDLMTMAERELAAFFTAVTELFGSEQAEVSAEDWLHELMAIHDLRINDLPASTRQWRQLTVKAAARLASLHIETKGQRKAMGNRSSAGHPREPILCGPNLNY
jgi:hypothetical protein